MSTLIWIIIAIVAVGIIIYLLKDKIFKKKEGGGPTSPPAAPGGPTM